MRRTERNKNIKASLTRQRLGRDSWNTCAELQFIFFKHGVDSLTFKRAQTGVASSFLSQCRVDFCRVTITWH